MMFGPGFRTEEVESPRTVGEVLKVGRERRRYTLEHVAKELRIRKTYLELLEADKFDKLPAEIYTKNYLRKYALFLHLDEKILLKGYNKQKRLYQKEKVEPDSGALPRRKKNSFSFILTPRLLKVSAIVILSLFFLTYLWYQVSDLSSPPELNIVEPAFEEETVTDTNLLVVGETSSDATLKINGQPIHLNSEGKFQENITLQEGLNKLQFEAENRLGKKIQVERKVFVEKP
ncbi:helix-turn-helix domain-containing protein [Patescibacteria group bacterium]|nr:helix-turn-helix domain-containing protein [Patescibacteria group bacterium]